jgi:Amt family ammonium transporter
MGFRVLAEDEATGVDLTQHAETAYDFGTIHLGHTTSPAVTGAGREVAGRNAEPATKAR